MVVVMTSNASLETATTALRAGAYDYLVKPFDDIEMISTVVNRAIDRYKLAADNRALMDHMKRNAEELERLNAKLTDMANRDALTGLHNHRYLPGSAGPKEISRASGTTASSRWCSSTSTTSRTTTTPTATWPATRC